MAVSYVPSGRLAKTENNSTITFTGVTLPAGRLIFCLGWRAGSTLRSSLSLTHSALSSSVKILEAAGASSASVTVRMAIYDCQSNGGTASLSCSFSGSIWSLIVHTLAISEVAPGIGSTASNNGSGVASLQVTPTHAGAVLGIAVVAAEPTNSTGVLQLTPWNDLYQTDSTNSGYLKLTSAAEETSPSGQTLTASMSAGSFINVSMGAVLFSPLTGTSSAALLMG